MHKMFKTKDNILTGQHLTNDSDLVAGLKEYVKERKDEGMKEEFVVKAVGRQKTATYDTLPQNTNWVEFYKTMLPHEDILLILEGKEKNGNDWGHMVTANSLRPSVKEIWWTPDGCIWLQKPPYLIDFMDHNEDTGYREVEMDENGNITGLEKYYTELSEENQTIYSMIVFSPKTAYEDLWTALMENQSTHSDWMPIGKGIPSLELQELCFNWNTTSIADGSYLLMATAIDEAGNEASDIIWTTVDNSAPTTTKTIGEPESGDGSYLTSDTAIALSAADGEGIGVDSLYYRIWNNGTWSDWTWIYCGPVIVEGMSDSHDFEAGDCMANFTLPGNCTHHIEYYAVDIVGNNETIQNQTHIVDNEAPITLKDVGEPSYYVTSTTLGEHWIITNGTYLLLNGADDCCKIDEIYLKNNGSKTYFIRVKHKNGFKDTIITPGERKKITPEREYTKLTITISERKGGKSNLIMKEDLNCSVLKFLALLGTYEKVGDRYTYNESIGPSPFGITDLLLEEFSLKECKGSALKCWSGMNATMYREWYNGAWSEWGEYTEPFTLEGGGIHYLEYYSVDVLANQEDVNNETFFVTDELLEPFFVTPSNRSLVYNNVTLWAGEATGGEVSYAMFWYSADGVNWTYIGIDDDGSEPTVGGELVNASDWGDGWRVYWNTSGIEEGVYSIKVDMYGLGGIGTAQIDVYVDPTPPVPRIHEPFDEDVVHGTVQLSVNTTDENVSWVLWEYANKTEYYEKGVDEKIQFNYCRNISGKDLSAVCCGPTAAASCLKYWAEHGYPNITRNGTINQSELVERLARLMRTDGNGTSVSNCKKGIDNYLKECGYGYSNPHGLTVDIETDTNKLNFTRYRNELEANRENVLWAYKWNHNTSSCKWRNGHWVVGKSVNNTRSGNVSHEVDIMCPTYGNVSNVRMYDNGTFYRPDVGWRYPSAMVTVSEKGSFEDPDWVEIANVTDPAGGWAALWDTLEVANGYYFIRVTLVDETGNDGKDIIVVKVENAPLAFFDTGEGTYPSIEGRHNGTIKPARDLNVNKMYTYPCVGTGGHTEYVKIWNTTGWNVSAAWNGYKNDWQTISFDKPFMLRANETYNYTIVTGSYPQIIHEPSWNATGGIITCTSFEDANGMIYEGWIPAIKLE
ncbi:MAG TPA: hypothetical protein VMW67_00315 [Desulfobacteria bacterium]|nr:hypothetical protein [Desulfobacteria bacterium]